MCEATRVLFVDDEQQILKALRRLFRRQPWEKCFVSSAEEALAAFGEQGPFDVVVTDQRMPGVTGVDLLKEIRSRYPECIRIVLSGYTDVQSILDAVNEGAIYKFLTKPWDDEVLTQVVTGAVESVELRRENERLLEVVESQSAQLVAMNQSLKGSFLEGVDARALLDVLPVGVIVVGGEERIALANREARRLLGAPEGLVGTTWEWPFGAAGAKRRITVRRSGPLTTAFWQGVAYALWEE